MSQMENRRSFREGPAKLGGTDGDLKEGADGLAVKAAGGVALGNEKFWKAQLGAQQWLTNRNGALGSSCRPSSRSKA